MGQDPRAAGTGTLTQEGDSDAVLQPSDAAAAAARPDGAPAAARPSADGQLQGPPDTQRLREEIAHTRTELGETVATLVHKADIKAQARSRVEDTKTSVVHKKEKLLGKARDASPESASSLAVRSGKRLRENPLPIAVLAAFAVGLLIGRRLSG